MWPEISNPSFWRIIAAQLCIGIAIKLTDDFLDQEEDRILQKRNLATYLGDSVLPYTVLVVLLAGLLEIKMAISYYFAAYGVGMLRDPKQTYLSGLEGWQESIIIWSVSWVLVGWHQTMTAGGIMLGVQLVDDLLDYQQEPTARNLAIQYGRAPLCLTLVIILITTLYSALWQLLATLVAWVGLSAFLWLINRFWLKRGQACG